MMRIFTVLLAGLLLSACQQGPSAEQIAKEKELKMTHESEIKAWRAERIDKLTTRDGWLSLVGMHWLPKDGVTRVGSGQANGTRISVGPENLGLIGVSAGNSVWFQPEGKVPVTVDGQPASGRIKLTPDTEGTPTVVGFKGGEASFIVIERGGKLALRVRDAQSPALLGFSGIDYFSIDRAFRVEAEFTAHEAGRTMDIVNILGMVEPMMNPGTVSFSLGGQRYTLEALDEGDHRLFFVFADRSSGHDSYPAGRFVYADYPGVDGRTILDFNKAYNPPCAFNPYSTCPMPPPENRLDVLIAAGEKKPRKTAP
jgi:uncharacterized protein (DUF1684 family)